MFSNGIPWLWIFVMGLGYIVSLELVDRIDRRAERQRRGRERGTRQLPRPLPPY